MQQIRQPVLIDRHRSAPAELCGNHLGHVIDIVPFNQLLTNEGLLVDPTVGHIADTLSQYHLATLAAAAKKLLRNSEDLWRQWIVSGKGGGGRAVLQR